ncbi:MAG: redox-sensing transcriptional repressor Rex, partial [Oscillospiraceae bacterium]|nr:redox-sensing transcriptional repressor Rex [Oscillospiraceae bacterium]
ERKVPEVVIKRLPRYYRYLSDLKNQDVQRISSNELSKLMGVTASQIRQDLNYFGGFGQQGYGYNVYYLIDEIGKILGLADGDTTIIIGAGNLGRALANHNSFEKRGFKLIGIFDNDRRIIGSEICGIRVRSDAELEEYIKENNVDIAILTVPNTAVTEMAERVVRSGIKGILNFSYTELDLPENIPVENVHLSDSLMTLAYRVKKSQEKTDGV